MISAILNIYILILIADMILSYLPQFKNYPAALYIKKGSDLTCRPVRRLLRDLVPKDFPFDFSPMVVILAIKFVPALIFALW
jgi:YggT family protein